MNIGIGSDHAGLPLKQGIITLLHSLSHEVEDVGTHTTASCDYPTYAHPVAKGVSDNQYNIGILICGSANGVAMVANKYPTVRAAICWDTPLAELARQHNDANILCLPARFIESEKAIEIVNAFLTTAFEQGRHKRRIDAIPIS